MFITGRASLRERSDKDRLSQMLGGVTLKCIPRDGRFRDTEILRVSSAVQREQWSVIFKHCYIDACDQYAVLVLHLASY